MQSRFRELSIASNPFAVIAPSAVKAFKTLKGLDLISLRSPVFCDMCPCMRMAKQTGPEFTNYIANKIF
jgi:hypothetical protein